MSKAQTLCNAIGAMPHSVPTFTVSKIVRENAIGVHYYGTGCYDEVFTMIDGSQILWNDSGFNPL